MKKNIDKNTFKNSYIKLQKRVREEDEISKELSIVGKIVFK